MTSIGVSPVLPSRRFSVVPRRVGCAVQHSSPPPIRWARFHANRWLDRSVPHTNHATIAQCEQPGAFARWSEAVENRFTRQVDAPTFFVRNKIEGDQLPVFKGRLHSVTRTARSLLLPQLSCYGWLFFSLLIRWTRISPALSSYTILASAIEALGTPEMFSLANRPSSRSTFTSTS